jgi:hypothetical protein
MSARYQQGAAEAARAAGVQVLFDPATERLADIGFELPGVSSYNGAPYDLDRLARDARARASLVATRPSPPTRSTSARPKRFCASDPTEPATPTSRAGCAPLHHGRGGHPGSSGGHGDLRARRTPAQPALLPSLFALGQGACPDATPQAGEATGARGACRQPARQAPWRSPGSWRIGQQQPHDRLWLPGSRPLVPAGAAGQVVHRAQPGYLADIDGGAVVEAVRPGVGPRPARRID